MVMLIICGLAVVIPLLGLLGIWINDSFEKRFQKRHSSYPYLWSFLSGFLLAGSIAAVLFFTVVPRSSPVDPLRVAGSVAVSTPAPTKKARNTPTPTVDVRALTAPYQYQAQAGMNIKATAKPTATRKPTATPQKVKTYVLNRSTKVFHTTSCSWGKKIAAKNRDTFNGTRQQVINKGYRPCGHCNP